MGDEASFWIRRVDVVRALWRERPGRAVEEIGWLCDQIDRKDAKLDRLREWANHTEHAEAAQEVLAIVGEDEARGQAGDPS